ncbi:MAG: hypothetical protein P1P90_02985 [Patescibacteria group bacterium]|nr:hypothetical protein [Patescibacteria group bacterium]
MKFLNIYTASWAPSSTLHLKDYYRALAYWESSNFKRSTIKTWVKDMEIEEIQYSSESINVIGGRFVNRLFFRVSEDGMIIVGKNVEDAGKDSQRLDQFLSKKMNQLWDNLFSRGAALPKVFEEIESRHPVLITLSKAKPDDLDKVFRDFKVIPYKKIQLEKGEVWIGETLVIINNSDYSKEVTDKMVEHLLFARVYEIQLERFVKGYEVLWNKVDGIRKQSFIQQTELAHVHDLVLNIQSQASFFTARLNQMQHFLDWRRKLIDEYVVDPALNATFKRFFMSLNSSQKYLQELWGMLTNYIRSTVSLMSFLYSDNERKNLALLQKLFLISTVAAIITLGGIAIIDLQRIVVFGGLAIVLSAFVHYLLFTVLSKYRKISLFKRDIELEKGKT